MKAVDAQGRERVAFEQTMASVHSGPIPSPEQLAGYKAVQPDLVERIVKMAELQAQHRQEIEKNVVNTSLTHASRGMWMGFVLGLSGLAAAVVVTLYNHPVVGSVIGTIDIVSLVSVFVIGKVKHPGGTPKTPAERNLPPKTPAPGTKPSDDEDE